MSVKKDTIMVVGMKASGISVASLLMQHGHTVVCYDDSNERISGFEYLDKITSEIIKKFDYIVVSPSIPPEHTVIQNALLAKIPIFGELEIGCQYLDCPQIMVTGTNGKTTVVTMIEKLLSLAGFKTKAVGNIGYPVSQLALDKTKLDYAVIEVSSFQLEYIDKIKPYISVILNLAPDHLDRYKSYNDYVICKRKISINQDKNDYIFFNNEDGLARQFINFTKAKGMPVSTSKKLSSVYIKDNYYMHGDKTLCNVKLCKLRGEHNKFNLLIALNIGVLLGVCDEHLVRLIKDYTLLPNRIEYVSTLYGKNYYNDSKGTNIHACRYAIASMEGSVGLIMGGSDKNEDFCEFFENISEKIKFIAVTGGNAQKIYNSAMKMGFTNICITNTLKDAVNILSKKDVNNVLLSPCCASFDRYRNYNERGEKFKEAVYAIKI